MALDARDGLRCPGCHAGDFADFDHYCDVNNVSVEDTPIAFAAWLNGVSGGAWDGDAGPIREVTGDSA